MRRYVLISQGPNPDPRDQVGGVGKMQSEHLAQCSSSEGLGLGINSYEYHISQILIRYFKSDVFFIVC